GYCVLVSREHATELSQLGPRRTPFLEEMAMLAEAIGECFRPVKLNYELLGNQVPHLHWHLIPRYDHDPDRRRPVWFTLEMAERDSGQRLRFQTGHLPVDECVRRLRNWLQGHGAPVAIA
ncbi:MAG: HIT family protein, partial [Gemmataceae bacterium]|nr:HIT family protein [Gemmataceae bacterium]